MRLTFFQDVLLVTAAGLAALLLVELSLLMPGDPTGESRSPESLLQPLDPSGDDRMGFALPPRKSLRDFVERPLFDKSRRSAGGSSAMGEEAAVGTDIALVGTVITTAETIAILQAQNGKPTRVRIGDSVEGWHVLQITQDGVLVSNNWSERWLSTGAQN